MLNMAIKNNTKNASEITDFESLVKEYHNISSDVQDLYTEIPSPAEQKNLLEISEKLNSVIENWIDFRDYLKFSLKSCKKPCSFTRFYSLKFVKNPMDYSLGVVNLEYD